MLPVSFNFVTYVSILSQMVLAKLGELLQRDYRNRVLKTLAYPEEDFWHKKNLLPDDWIGTYEFC